MSQRFRNFLQRGGRDATTKPTRRLNDTAVGLDHFDDWILIDSGPSQLEISQPPALDVTPVEEQTCPDDQSTFEVPITITHDVSKDCIVIHIGAVASVATAVGANGTTKAAVRAERAVKLGPAVVAATVVQPRRPGANVRNVVRRSPKKVAGKSQKQPPPHRGYRRCSICFDQT